MQSSDAKRCSSSLKACPLTKEVTKEEIRDEEEEGMEMHGEFPACKREKMFFLPGMWKCALGCLREKGVKEGASSCKE